MTNNTQLHPVTYLALIALGVVFYFWTRQKAAEKRYTIFIHYYSYHKNPDNPKDKSLVPMRPVTLRPLLILASVPECPIYQKKKSNPENLQKILIPTISSKEAPSINLLSVNLLLFILSLTTLNRSICSFQFSF